MAYGAAGPENRSSFITAVQFGPIFCALHSESHFPMRLKVFFFSESVQKSLLRFVMLFVIGFPFEMKILDCRKEMFQYR